jgi:tRNA modification GTPase
LNDTIAALATPLGKGGLSVIRVSGQNSISALLSIFVPHKKKASGKIAPWRVYYGKLVDPQNNELIDDALITYFRKPRSYTGEDQVEISVHGSPVITKTILNVLYRLGIQPAQPGEFTRRAFQNGRIDLSQAEAIAQLISSESQIEQKLAAVILNGGLSKPVRTIREKLLQILSNLEMDLDFPEEQFTISQETTIADLDYILNEISYLLQASFNGKTLAQAFRITLCGCVNSGKSSMFNRLIGSERSIVSDEPGTTRDTVEKDLEISGIAMTILDTAGLRKTNSIAESEAINRTYQNIGSADLILYLIDGTDPDLETLFVLKSRFPEKAFWVLWNKIDLTGEPDTSKLDAITNSGIASVYKVSAKTGAGVSSLRDQTYSYIKTHHSFSLESTLLLTERQQNLLIKTQESLVFAKTTLTQNTLPECSIPDLRLAYKYLSEIVGEEISPDILDVIFSQFCIGK